GQGWAEFVHPEDEAALAPQRERSRATGQPYEGQIRYRSRDGGYRWHAFRALPAAGADGAAVQWFGCAVDIHEAREAQQALKEAEARFRALMDQAPFSMQIFAPDGRTRRVNAAWSLLWGLTQEQIADYNVLEDPQLEKKDVFPTCAAPSRERWWRCPRSATTRMRRSPIAPAMPIRRATCPRSHIP
ncbi:MAG TPA: PAS domain S-box protein, partial [Polyangiales bacterium]